MILPVRYTVDRFLNRHLMFEDRLIYRANSRDIHLFALDKTEIELNRGRFRKFSIKRFEHKAEVHLAACVLSEEMINWIDENDVGPWNFLVYYTGDKYCFEFSFADVKEAVKFQLIWGC